MTIGGWINMGLSVGVVTGMFIWCLCKVLRRNPEEPNPADEAYARNEACKR